MEMCLYFLFTTLGFCNAKCPNWLPIVSCIVHNDYVVPKVLIIVDDSTTQKLSSYHPILQLPMFSPKG